MKQKSILIIGGEGYIGNVITDIFIKKNYLVTSFDNLIYNQKRNIRKNKNYKFIYGDIRKKKDLIKINKNYEAVIYLAGLVGDPITSKYKKLASEINEKYTKKTINYFYNNKKIKRFIFVSTCSNYGISKTKYLKENNRLNPISPYAKSKVKIEKFILNLKKKDFTPTILRFATAFGLSKRMRYDLTINQFTRELFKKRMIEVYDFNTWRPYCHVKDFARLIHKVIKSKKSNIYYQIFNCGGNNNNFTKKTISKKIKKYTGGEIYYLKKSQDKRNYIVDFSKVRKILNFKPKFNIDYGIKEILKNLRTKKIKHRNIQGDNFGNYKIIKKY